MRNLIAKITRKLHHGHMSITKEEKELMNFLDPGVAPDEFPKAPYDMEQIRLLKLMGEPRPDDVTPAEWARPLPHSYIDEAILIYASEGRSVEKIAEITQKSERYIRTILNQSQGQIKIKQHQDRYLAEEAKERINQKLMAAVGVVEEIMENVQIKPNVRLDAAKYLLDRGLGKPSQDINVQTNVLSEFIKKLDDKETMRDVEEVEPNAIDAMVADIIPEKLTVGDKNG